MGNRLSHIISVISFALMRLPIPRTHRNIFMRMGGIRLTGRRYFIASDVEFDTVYPQNITLHDDVHITSGVRLLTHMLDTSNPDRNDIHWKEGRIEICEHAFIGTGSIITGNVRIGRGAIVGAGSVVTRDIPSGVVAAGNPCRVIRKIGE